MRDSSSSSHFSQKWMRMGDASYLADQLQNLSVTPNPTDQDEDLGLKREAELTRTATAGSIFFNDPEDDPQSIQNQLLNVHDALAQGDTNKKPRIPNIETISRVPSGHEVFIEDTSEPVPLQRVETGATAVQIEWTDDSHAEKVYVTGAFANWRTMIPLKKREKDGTFSTTIYLKPGTHRLEFVVDGQLQTTNKLPTATDAAGSLFNYIEVGSDRVSSDSEDDGYTQYKDDVDMMEPKIEYTTEIPEACLHPENADKLLGENYINPPFLPPHLETAVVNSMNKEKEDSSVLPIPNHVVINHLATTSIKHNVLAVASTCRYSRKFVTQILYAPLS